MGPGAAHPWNTAAPLTASPRYALVANSGPFGFLGLLNTIVFSSSWSFHVNYRRNGVGGECRKHSCPCSSLGRVSTCRRQAVHGGPSQHRETSKLTVEQDPRRASWVRLVWNRLLPSLRQPCESVLPVSLSAVWKPACSNAVIVIVV